MNIMEQKNITLHFNKTSNEKAIGMTLTQVKVSVSSSTPDLDSCIEQLKILSELKEVVTTPTETIIEFKLKCYRFIPSIESFESEFWASISKVNQYMNESGFGLFDYHFTLTSETTSVSNIKNSIDLEHDLRFSHYSRNQEQINLGSIDADIFFDFPRILYQGCSIAFTIPKVSADNHFSYNEMLERCPWVIEDFTVIDDEDVVEVTTVLEDIVFVGNIDYISEILTTVHESLDRFLEEFGITNIPFRITPLRVSPPTID